MYQLQFKNSVKKDFKSIDIPNIKYIKKSLEEFAKNFSTSYEQEMMKLTKIKKLQGQDEELYRLRLRSYRIIYKKEDEKLIILVLRVKSRQSAYKT